MTQLVNINHAKKCAFCKYWYDPTNSNISPKTPQFGIWQINDANKKCLCIKKNLQVPAHASCPKYECKI